MLRHQHLHAGATQHQHYTREVLWHQYHTRVRAAGRVHPHLRVRHKHVSARPAFADSGGGGPSFLGRHMRSGGDPDIPTLCPDLRTLLTVPAERDGVVARGQIRGHLDLVDDVEADERLVERALFLVVAGFRAYATLPFAAVREGELAVAAPEAEQAREGGLELRLVAPGAVHPPTDWAAARWDGFFVHMEPAGLVPCDTRVALMALRSGMSSGWPSYLEPGGPTAARLPSSPYWIQDCSPTNCR